MGIQEKDVNPFANYQRTVMRATAIARMAQMRYPLTAGAKLMQFPYKFHYNNCWYFRAICTVGIPMTVVFSAFMQYKVNGNKFHYGNWHQPQTSIGSPVNHHLDTPRGRKIIPLKSLL